MVPARLTITDFSSAEEPWEIQSCSLAKIEASKQNYNEDVEDGAVSKDVGGDLRCPGENGFLVHVQQDERVLTAQARDLLDIDNDDGDGDA